jgi:hypothetical protein
LLLAVRALVGIRKAPHTRRPKLVRPTSLILAYCERAAGTRVSVVPPIGPEAIVVIVLIATPIALAARTSIRAANTAADLFDG